MSMYREMGMPIEILLVEDNPGDVRLIREMLAAAGQARIEVIQVARLSEAFKLLQEETVTAVLLDLNLPDSYGLETFRRVQEQAPQVPIVVLTGLADESLGMQAVQGGAQDYLVKGQVDGHLLARSLRYALERHRTREVLRSLALMDDLTGLYNRRGFMALAEQQLKLAGRGHREFLLISADLDGMKHINDTFGHQEGDLALRETARVLEHMEAMASYRPYRPALGIEKALEEITTNKGSLYDPEVVDVCVTLFAEKGFVFE